MKKILIILVALIGFGISANAQWITDDMFYDSDNAFRFHQQDAEDGDPIWQSYLGDAYANMEDYETAVFWWKKSAEQGFVNAQYNMGVAYHFGVGGVSKDYVQASFWYLSAAKQGYASAMINLGVIYDELENYEQAIYWYKKSAEEGNEKACYNLGIIYHYGKAGKIDYVQAFNYFQKATGFPNAQYFLGYYYENGYGGATKDSLKAIDWYRKAAEGGDVNAKKRLKIE